MNLKEYERRRHFKKTTEPKGALKKSPEKNRLKPSIPIFVIQEHHASHHHFDLRLEDKGVLKSWAVPKGIPKNITEKHLAVQTEDHPLEYAHFSGKIPEGEYGAGTVKIHDQGFFENMTHNKDYKPVSITQGLKNGHIIFRLYGKHYKKVVFALHRFRREKNDMWLLMQIKKS